MNSRAKSAAFDSGEEVRVAATVPVPGGVVLSDEEHQLRAGKPPKSAARALIVARSILRKVRSACAVGAS